MIDGSLGWWPWTCHTLGQRFRSSNGKQHWANYREFIASSDWWWCEEGEMRLRPRRQNSHGSHGSITKIKCEMLWNCICMKLKIIYTYIRIHYTYVRYKHLSDCPSSWWSSVFFFKKRSAAAASPAISRCTVCRRKLRIRRQRAQGHNEREMKQQRFDNFPHKTQRKTSYWQLNRTQCLTREDVRFMACWSGEYVGCLAMNEGSLHVYIIMYLFR